MFVELPIYREDREKEAKHTLESQKKTSNVIYFLLPPQKSTCEIKGKLTLY